MCGLGGEAMVIITLVMGEMPHNPKIKSSDFGFSVLLAFGASFMSEHPKSDIVLEGNIATLHTNIPGKFEKLKYKWRQ